MLRRCTSIRSLESIIGTGDNETIRLKKYMSSTGLRSKYFEHSRPEVVELVSPSASRILDIGCASGFLGAALKQRGACEVWGIEVDPTAAASAQLRLDRVIEGNLPEVGASLEDETFDTVIMADVLEHVVDTAAMLALARRVMTPEGKLVLSVPNVRHWSVLRMLLGGHWRYQDEGIMDRTHVRFFTLRSTLATLRHEGFSVEHLAGTKVTAPPPSGFIEELEALMDAQAMHAKDLAREALLFQLLFVCSKTPRQ